MAVKQKKINGSGGVTIPSDIRRDLGFEKGTGVDIEVQAGKLIISKRTPRCTLCGGTEKVIKHFNKDVCHQCINDMEARINGK